MLCGAGDPTQHIIGKYYTTELHFQSFKYILELAYQYFFFVTRGIKLRASGLRGKYSPTWATPPAFCPFVFILCLDGGLTFLPGVALNSLSSFLFLPSSK